MNTNTKKATAITLILLASALLSAGLATAQAPDDAIITVLAGVGGTTTPTPGTYNYANGTIIMLSATADDGFQFEYWIVTGEVTPGHTPGFGGVITDPDTGEIIQVPAPRPPTTIDSLVFTANPVNITCGYGYTYNYQPVFGPVTGATPAPSPSPQTSPPTSTKQTVRILSSIGGSTSPTPGTYTYNEGQTFTLSATANSGFAFHYWIVQGEYVPGHQAQPQWIPGVTEQVPTVPTNIYRPSQDSLVFSTNPATITCGYGYTYTYQAIFTPTGDTHANVIPTATPPPTTGPTPTPAANTPTPTAAPTATPPPAAADYTWAIIAAVVVIIIIIIVVAAVMMRKKQ